MARAKKLEDRDTIAPKSDTPNVLLQLAILGCTIALLVLSCKAAVRIHRFPELRASTKYPRFSGAVIGPAVWAGLATFLSVIIGIRWCTAWRESPRYPPSEMVALAVNGGMNLVMAGALAALVGVQTEFLPRPWGQCWDEAVGQLRWMVILAQGHGFRERAEYEQGGGGKERHDVCMVFAGIWRLEVALIILLVFTSACNIYGASQRWGSRARANTRYLNRAAQRRRELAVLQAQLEQQQQRDGHAASDLAMVRPDPTSTLPRQLTSGARGLEAILSQYELLETIVSHSHYHSIYSLLQVSRGIRATMLECMPARSLWAKSLCNQLHRDPYATTTPPCFSCGTPACPTCSTQQYLSDATIRHLRDCTPCCSTCFRDRYCFLPRVGTEPEAPELPARCNWVTVPHQTRVLDSNPAHVDAEGSREYMTVYASSVKPTSVHVCLGCSEGKAEAQIVGLGGEAGVGKSCAWARVVLVEGQREAKVVRDMGMGGLRCVRCDQGIAEGMFLWWMCEWCGRECVDGFHTDGGGVVPRACGGVGRGYEGV